MSNLKEPIEQLNEIRSMMERSQRFISLSGLSGITAGLAALTGSMIAWFKSDPSPAFLFVDALIVLIVAFFFAIYFTTRRARKKRHPIWDRSARRLLINLLLPLAAGGLFCLILIYHDLFILLPSVTLVFYGLALVNASKYTLPEIRIMGIAEIITGLAAGWFPDYGLIFWAAGFGVFHIIYGIAMYNRYEKTE